MKIGNDILSESQWETLLDAIETGKVVPIIGAGLLELPASADGELPQPLEEAVARHLLITHRLAQQSAAPQLADVIARLNSSKAKNLDLQAELRLAYQTASKDLIAAPPIALREVAAISAFKMFVTLTPDAVVAAALSQQNRVLKEVIHDKRQATALASDLPSDWKFETSLETPLLYLFGKATDSRSEFAVHEEDRLEYTHDLITRQGNAPKRFLQELELSHLLVIGARMNDWLYRFFLRLNNGKRLNQQRECKEWLAENFDGLDDFHSFVGDFTCGSSIPILVKRPQIFVAQLALRWRKRHPDALKPYVPEPHQPRRPMFFISYSRSTDAMAAENMVRALADELDPNEVVSAVWFDRRELGTGDPFWQRIREAISNCAYFLPLISIGADARQEAAFREEWLTATERLKRMAETAVFVIPVVVDAEFASSKYTTLPQLWRDRSVDLGHAPGGVPNASLQARLRSHIRALRTAAL